MIADAAVKQGLQVAVHYAGSPMGQMAACHMIATIDNFVAMENHGLDMPWWQDLVKEHLREPGYFEPTNQYDDIKIQGFHSGGAWLHYDDDGNWCNCVSYE